MTHHFKTKDKQMQIQTNMKSNRKNNGQFNHYRFRKKLD